MQIQKFQGSARQLPKLANQPQTEPEEASKGPSDKSPFLEGVQLGAAHFGVPALAGLLVPQHPFLAGAVAGAAVVAVRAGGFVKENRGAMISAAIVGGLSGYAGGHFGLPGVLGATALGGLSMGLQNSNGRY